MLQDITNAINAKKRKLKHTLESKLTSVVDSSNSKEDDALINELVNRGSPVTPFTMFKQMLANTDWEVWCATMHTSTKDPVYKYPWNPELFKIGRQARRLMALIE
jgi:hypothetical protein